MRPGPGRGPPGCNENASSLNPPPFFTRDFASESGIIGVVPGPILAGLSHHQLKGSRHVNASYNPPAASGPRFCRDGSGGLAGPAHGFRVGTDACGARVRRSDSRSRVGIPAAPAGCKGGVVDRARAGDHRTGGHGPAAFRPGHAGRPDGHQGTGVSRRFHRAPRGGFPRRRMPITRHRSP